MSDTPSIVQEEVNALHTVRERLLRTPPTPPASEAELVEELSRILEDIKHGKMDDKAALEQQYEQQLRVLEQLRASRERETVDPDSPYFAHMKLTQDGKPNEVFLGRATRLEDGLRIVDWRHAPVAQLYYRYQEGDEFEEEIGNRTVEGVIHSRRAITAVDGALERVICPQGTFLREESGWSHVDPAKARRLTGEGSVVWHQAPNGQQIATGKVHKSDKHLADIASLIDPQQFELIARPDSGPVVVRGGAGSGKTTVALHRVAYLNYQDPRRFSAAKMQIVVWGKALRDYVSKVLPSLGVQGVPVVTWSEWSRKMVQRHFPSLPGHSNANTPAAVSRIKLHSGLIPLLAQRIKARKAGGSPSQAIEDWKQLLTDATAIGSLSGVRPEDVQTCMEWSRQQFHQLSLREERDKSAEPWLDEEDDALLLRAWQLRVGPFKAKGGGQVVFSHIVVDEVQDFSGMELAVLLGCLDNKRCITLSGDTQQHIQQVGGSELWSDLLQVLGIEPKALSSLRVSYRSTREITWVSRAILGPLAEEEGATYSMRNGDPVDVFTFPDPGACVDFLGHALRRVMVQEPMASVAVITPDERSRELYFEALEKMSIPRLRRVVEQTFAFAPGIDVVDVQQVKGLEFDYVVVVDANARAYTDRSSARRLLHVAASRAVHRLWIAVTGAPSPLLEGLR